METGHSTAREAAIVARDAGVAALLLTHFSARYSRDAGELGRESARVLRETRVRREGWDGGRGPVPSVGLRTQYRYHDRTETVNATPRIIATSLSPARSPGRGADPVATHRHRALEEAHDRAGVEPSRTFVRMRRDVTLRDSGPLLMIQL